MSPDEFVWPVRVYYEDTDAGGVVYYANYLRFMERARTEWLRALGFEQDRLRAEQGLIFAVHHIEVRYLRPARFNDRLRVGVRIRRQGRASLVFDQAIRGEAGEPVCAGTVKIACIDVSTFRPRPIPAAILEGIHLDH